MRPTVAAPPYPAAARTSAREPRSDICYRCTLALILDIVVLDTKCSDPSKPSEPTTRSRVLSNVRYLRSRLAKATVCTAIYPGFTILLLVAVRVAPLQEEAKRTLVGLLMWALWPVRAVGDALPRLVDALGPQGGDEPASMFLPTWEQWLLGALQFALPISLVFAAWLVFFQWVRSARRLSRAERPSNNEYQRTKQG